MKTIQLNPGETIVAVVPRTSECSGGRRQLVDVYVHNNRKDTVELECIQAVDMSPEMQTLFAAGEAMSKALLAAVPEALK
jgi:hypothetical protein